MAIPFGETQNAEPALSQKALVAKIKSTLSLLSVFSHAMLSP